MPSTPKGIRTPVAAVRGRCPGPLDDGGVSWFEIVGLLDRIVNCGLYAAFKNTRRQGEWETRRHRCQSEFPSHLLSLSYYPSRYDVSPFVSAMNAVSRFSSSSRKSVSL